MSEVRRNVAVMAFFAVTTVHGPDWDDSRPIREQRAWDEHAAFMDGLVEDGLVVLGGPVGDGQQALLAVEAADAGQIQARFATDPWLVQDVLRIGLIQPWSIWLDGRPAPSS
jgi:uncharacterized protein YciI